MLQKTQFHECQYNFTFVTFVLHQRYVNMSCNIIETNTAIETFKMFIKKTGKFYFYIKKLQKNRIRKKGCFISF